MYDYAERYITLRDCEVVIDGQSFFYQLYRVSGLQSMFGCESDKYAQFLRNYLSKFKKANVKCYFFFKGGHEDASKMWNKNNPHKTEQFKIGKTAVGNVDCKPLIFTKEVYEQVLEEMHFDYVICQYESKRECIAFAQTRNCPIISYDIEYGFSGVPYISANPHSKEHLNMPRCKVFTLDNLMHPVDGDTGIDNHLILYADKLAARRNLAEYLDELAEDDDMVIFDGQRIHTIVEFQLCLQHLNFLNRLCGRPYQSTVYSKTYNGTLVHRILFSLTNQNEGTCAFIENKLKTAPTVLAFWNRLIGAFDEIN
ncbi:uncharacterized protein LOC113240144 [Hyposmocoma kahamanoa]|uniref:uncharacterized protein LOC113240144 n=1 Tax=Hyposmocoma kahamanoa TaxID=1477025 RepID=UPI000E6D7717|nr:uncharacterized protein LOC113240144 [Hyposmocoma kahamanoa]